MKSRVKILEKYLGARQIVLTTKSLGGKLRRKKFLYKIIYSRQEFKNSWGIVAPASPLWIGLWTSSSASGAQTRTTPSPRTSRMPSTPVRFESSATTTSCAATRSMRAFWRPLTILLPLSSFSQSTTPLLDRRCLEELA